MAYAYAGSNVEQDNHTIAGHENDNLCCDDFIKLHYRHFEEI